MERRTRIGIAVTCIFCGAFLAGLAWARYDTFHNETFDLAFYARMAWGIPRLNIWDPIIGANVLGLHISPVVAPLGLLGMGLGTVPVLLVAQAAAVTATAWPLALMGHRRLGRAGAILGAAAWLLFPNIGHVATYEFHPGTLAVLPLAWALEAMDRRSPRLFAWAVVGVLACREDLALITCVLGLLAYRKLPELRAAGRAVAVVSLAWVLVFALVLHPLFGPAQGSMQLHFGQWGDTAPEALVAMLTQPVALLTHLMAAKRLTYLLLLFSPLAFLPLLRPRLLLAALPVLAMNLVSDWPTTTDLDSHYQTPALPMLVAAALEGAAVVARTLPPRRIAAGVMATVFVSHLLFGGTPLAADFDARAFRPDARTEDLRSLLSQIPPGASVQAPYAAMPHLAERLRIGPPPPPERITDFVLLDLWHRARHARHEALLRTTEEPTARQWLARADHGVVGVRGTHVLLERGADPRGPVLARYFVERATRDEGHRIAACLSVLGARLDGEVLVLDLLATGPCPADLALRFGTGRRPRRVDLPFDGLLSPAHLRAGDHLRSRHPLDVGERAEIGRDGLRVGALRSSGARPEHADPVAVDVPLGPAQPPASGSPSGSPPSAVDSAP